MTERKNQVGTRSKNAFDTRDASDAVDSPSTMVQWLDEDVPVMKCVLPCVVGKIPDLGQTSLTTKSKRRGIGRFSTYSFLLLSAFVLGAFSGSFHPSVDRANLSENVETPEPADMYDSDVAQSDEWPDLETLTNDANAALAEYSFNSSSEPSPFQPDDVAFSSLDSMALGEHESIQNVRTIPNEIINDSRSQLAAQEWDGPNAGSDASPLSVASAQNSAFANDHKVDDSVFSTSREFSGGFADYSLDESSPSSNDHSVQFPQPTQTAEIDRDHFLSNVVPQENKFNDNAKFNGYEAQFRQNNSADDVNSIASANESGYNNQLDFNEEVRSQSSDRIALTSAPRNQESAQTSSRFQGFGSSWDDPVTNSDVPSGSPFPNDSLGGEYVAQNFEEQVVAPPIQAQKPARSIRW